MRRPRKLPITVLVAARDEAANLPRCLGALGPAQRVVVVDSRSADGTALIAQRHGAEVAQFTYRGGYPRKRQWALEHARVRTPWTLLIDADEIVPAPLWAEIAAAIEQEDGPAAYLVTKGFHFMGRRFRFGGFSHAAVILFRTGCARFERLLSDPGDGLDMEVHERLIVDGAVGALQTPLVHEDFKGLEAYLERHRRYAVWESRLRQRFLETGRWGEDAITPRLAGNAQERRRFVKKWVIRLPLEPWLWFVYHYVLRLGMLEGRPGFIASRIRAQYIGQVRALLRDGRRSGARPAPAERAPR